MNARHRWTEKRRAAARIEVALADPDPGTRRAAIHVAADRGLRTFAAALAERARVEQDDAIRRTLVQVVLDNEWEPSDSHDLVELRLWGSHRRRPAREAGRRASCTGSGPTDARLDGHVGRSGGQQARGGRRIDRCWLDRCWLDRRWLDRCWLDLRWLDRHWDPRQSRAGCRPLSPRRGTSRTGVGHQSRHHHRHRSWRGGGRLGDPGTDGRRASRRRGRCRHRSRRRAGWPTTPRPSPEPIIPFSSPPCAGWRPPPAQPCSSRRWPRRCWPWPRQKTSWRPPAWPAGCLTPRPSGPARTSGSSPRSWSAPGFRCPPPTWGAPRVYRDRGWSSPGSDGDRATCTWP